MAFTYKRSITVDHTKVAGNLSNFPMLVSYTNNDLRTVGNGGNVQNANGYDICYFSDSAGTSALYWEMEYYNGATGNVVSWVKLPTISASVDDVIYTFYDDPTISTFQSTSSSVWDSNYKAVWHFGNPSSLTTTDSTANANNATNTGATATTGQIAGAALFTSSSDQYMTVPYTSSLAPAQVATYSAWVNKTSDPSSGGSYIMELLNDFAPSSVFFRLGLDGNIANQKRFGIVYYNGGFPAAGNSTDLNTATNYYITVTTDGTNARCYLNGAIDGTTAFTATPSANTADYTIGRLGGGGRNFYGWLDELRFSSGIARSANWIATEYANQNSPSTFFTLGAQQSVGGNVYNDTISDSATATDSLAVNLVISATISDSATATDSLSAQAVYRSTISDSATATDSMASAQIMGATISDSASATDTITAENVIYSSISDTANATDSLANSVTFNPSITDSASATDTIQDALITNATISDSASATDSFEEEATYNAAINDSASATDSIASQANYVDEISDSANATDIMTNGSVYIEEITDSAQATDNLQVSYTANASISDTASATDQIQANQVLNNSISDTASASDFLTAQNIIQVSISDSASATDEITLGNVYDESFTDTAIATDILVTQSTVPNYILLGWIH